MLNLGIADDGLFLRTVAIETTVGSPLRSECGFDVAVQEYPFAHDEGARWVCAKGGDGMVGVVVVEAG